MKFVPIIGIILVSLSCQPFCETSAVQVVDGFADIGDSGTTENKCYQLKGDWEFYWQEFLPPSAFLETNILPETGYIYVPSKWQIFQINGTNLPGFGYATYRTRIRLPETTDSIGVNIRNISSAYSLYVNGILIRTNGIISTNRAGFTAYSLPFITNLNMNTDQMEIILHIANYLYRDGGLWENVVIGDSERITRKFNHTLWLEIFLIGSLMIMALYHFGLFILRRSDKTTLYFGLFCLFIALRIGVTGTMFIPRIMPGFSWSIFKKIEFLTFYLGLGFFNLFIHHMIPQIIQRKITNIIFITSAVFSLVVIITPTWVYSYSLLPFQIFTIIAGSYLLTGVFIQAVRTRKQEAVIIAIGSALFFLSVINDMLYAQFPSLIPYGHLVPWGVLIFIFSQSFSLSSRFSRAMTTVEELSRNLEAQVENRTRDLQRARDDINRLIEMNLSVTQKIYSHLNITQIAEHLIEEARKFTEFSDVSVFIHSPDTGYLEYIAGYGREGIEKHRFRPGEGIAGSVFLSGKPEMIPDLSSDHRFLKFKDNPNAMLIFPIQTVDEVIGVFNLGYDDPAYCDQSHFKLLSILVSTAGIAMEKALLYQDLESKVRQRTEQLSKAKKEAERANYNKTRFLANMSHELRTPLSAIIGFVELLIYGSLDKSDEVIELLDRFDDKVKTVPVEISISELSERMNEEIHWQNGAVFYLLDRMKQSGLTETDDTEQFNARFEEISGLIRSEEEEIRSNYFRIRSAGKNLLDLIESILNLSDVELGKIDIRIEPFSLQSYIDEESGYARELLDSFHKSDSVQFESAIDPALPQTVIMDREILRKIIRNLITNACQYTEKGKITLKVRFDPNRSGNLLFEVSDTGVGISENERKNIFLTFGRGDRNRHKDGSGFGLVLASKITEHLGGEIGFDSEEGKGSVFRVSLPTGV